MWPSKYACHTFKVIVSEQGLKSNRHEMLTIIIPKGIFRYMAISNDSTILSLKTKKQVKGLAQLRAKQLGIPLGTLVNAFLRDLGQTGEVHFTIAEPITPKMSKLIEEMRTDIYNGDTYGPFTVDEATNFLDNNSTESLKL